jgi:hypothetical protein
VPFSWDEDRRIYQRAWIAAKRKRLRAERDMTLADLIPRGRKAAAAVEKAKAKDAEKAKERRE